jgi:hypothetical protein
VVPLVCVLFALDDTVALLGRGASGPLAPLFFAAVVPPFPLPLPLRLGVESA